MGSPVKDRRKPVVKPNPSRVLFVTNEPPRFAPAVRRLEDAGLTVATVHGASVALVALARVAPHVVVVDVALKGLSAQEITRHIVDSTVDGRPMVILAGEEAATVERQGAAITSGAFDYFNLPDGLPLLVGRVAQLVALRREIVRLDEEANSDTLTGLSNRRRFHKRLGQEVGKWRRYGVPCSLLALDIDNMKRINDTHGHPAGDRAILHVAKALTEVARDIDVAARLGGEEFTLLLATVDAADALTVAEHLRQVISGTPVEGVGMITVSVGVASCPTHADSEKRLYDASDIALYRAKNEGRDCSVVAEPLNTAPPPDAVNSE
jgi:diguanylate cyclase (GGDEF)-like protein